MNKHILLSGLLVAILFMINSYSIYAGPPIPIPCEETVVGCFEPPSFWASWLDDPSGQDGGAIILFTRLIFRVLLVGAGIFAMWKFIQAGFSFMNAAGDPQKVSEGRDQITLTLMGILVIGGSFVLVAIIGIIFFKDPMIFIQPEITGAPTLTP